jgi:hypothetical protein
MRDLCQHIMDLVENSVASGAQRVTVLLSEDARQDRLSLLVEDDGDGMTPEVAERAADPFYTTRKTRRVGLGLSLLQAATQRSEGSFALDSAQGRGTRVECSFGLSHLDRPPLGDVVATLITLIALHPTLNLHYEHRAEGRRFVADTAELQASVGKGISLGEPSAFPMLREHLAEKWGGFLDDSSALRNGSLRSA